MNPFAPALLQTLARQHGTPLWVYDAATIRERIAEHRAFDTIRFAQKANSNIHLLRLMRERDPFIRLAGTGLACMFGVQAMINMGVAVRLLPAKGMTLPFVSYGGSSVIAAGLTIGALFALTRTRPQGDINDLFTRRGR